MAKPQRKWPEMPNVVGMIDGTSHEILIPSTEPQQDFYSGHRKYHCIHTQVICDNDKNICYIHSGFLGHDNDANAYHRIGPIGPGDALDFPPQCYILADSIYPNEYPLVTPFKSVEIIRQTRAEKRFRRKFNIYTETVECMWNMLLRKLKHLKNDPPSVVDILRPPSDPPSVVDILRPPSDPPSVGDILRPPCDAPSVVDILRPPSDPPSVVDILRPPCYPPSVVDITLN
ncbi:unnamed protein product [Mytilus coruscus]|uniref:DDE Tnp4 domain-containing protein n=1 Tax=Mytilus coruscus TaxID=42192 RepID=A0A6J7ZXV4_MYTCO|nr:unnamed protein product [Mytilus coruscus]